MSQLPRDSVSLVVEAREKLGGISQADLARLLGASSATVNRWERGHTRMSKRMLSRLRALLEEETAATVAGPRIQPAVDRLSSDKALTDPSDDRLGYTGFAKQLADIIAHHAPDEGLVTALYGPWGSGKSTLLNFIKSYLAELPQSEQPVLVEFNPWWFSGQEDLVLRFFDQLMSVLNNRKLLTARGRTLLARFATLVAESPVPDVIPGTNLARRSAHVMAELARPKDDLMKRKRDIEGELARSGKKIAVFIDDIDRLAAHEMRQVFQVIKAVADFPNLVYVLAFDKAVAVRALDEVQGIPGEAYLEKIVQVPFDLPLPDKAGLRRLLFERLDLILKDTDEDLFDQTRWTNIYFEGIDNFIQTPRNVVLLTNSLSATYPAVVGEVNAVDFIALEALRLFAPIVYDTIRKNPESFAGSTGTDNYGSNSVDSLRTFHDTWLERLDAEDRERVKALLKRLFPKLETVWTNTHYGYTWESTWRRQRRVCSPEVLPVYLRLSIPFGAISNSEMKATLAVANDPDAFAERLLKWASEVRPDGMTRVRELLERLEDYTDEIEVQNIASIVEAFFEVGDQLLKPEDRSRGMFDFGNDIRIGRVMWQLLKRLGRPQRTEILLRAAQRGEALAVITHEVSVLGQQHGRFGSEQPDPEDQRIVSEEGLAELEKVALRKIRQAAAQGRLLTTPDLPHILYRWRDWSGGEQEPREWATGMTDDDNGLLAFLAAFISVGWRQSISDVVGTKTYRLNPKVIQPFLDPASVAKRLPDILARKDIPEEQRHAAEQFLREYRLVEQGKDPNDPNFGDELEEDDH